MIKYHCAEFFEFEISQHPTQITTLYPFPIYYHFPYPNSQQPPPTNQIPPLLSQKDSKLTTQIQQQKNNQKTQLQNSPPQPRTPSQNPEKTNSSTNPIKKNTTHHKNKKIRKISFQNQLRNIQPNIIHQIFCFIQKQKRSKNIIERYLRSSIITQSQQFDINRFYHYQRLIKDKTNHYINMKGLQQLNKFHQSTFQIYSQHQQLKFIHMNRILFKYFLQHQFLNVTLTSTRMKSSTRFWHFQFKRKILKQQWETFKGC